MPRWVFKAGFATEAGSEKRMNENWGTAARGRLVRGRFAVVAACQGNVSRSCWWFNVALQLPGRAQPTHWAVHRLPIVSKFQTIRYPNVILAKYINKKTSREAASNANWPHQSSHKRTNWQESRCDSSSYLKQRAGVDGVCDKSTVLPVCAPWQR